MQNMQQSAMMLATQQQKQMLAHQQVVHSAGTKFKGDDKQLISKTIDGGAPSTGGGNQAQINRQLSEMQISTSQSNTGKGMQQSSVRNPTQMKGIAEQAKFIQHFSNMSATTQTQKPPSSDIMTAKLASGASQGLAAHKTSQDCVTTDIMNLRNNQ